VLLDGFIVSAAAALACQLSPEIKPALIAAHRTTEPGHRLLLEHLGLKPLIDLEMRLGEASGALVALPILDAAANLFNRMKTFSEAGLPDQTP
jgi:nicotinate-nucleotide--dimethylbenzimidazole phosphoribosyltransferase